MTPYSNKTWGYPRISGIKIKLEEGAFKIDLWHVDCGGGGGGGEEGNLDW